MNVALWCPSSIEVLFFHQIGHASFSTPLYASSCTSPDVHSTCDVTSAGPRHRLSKWHFDATHTRDERVYVGSFDWWWRFRRRSWYYWWILSAFRISPYKVKLAVLKCVGVQICRTAWLNCLAKKPLCLCRVEPWETWFQVTLYNLVQVLKHDIMWGVLVCAVMSLTSHARGLEMIVGDKSHITCYEQGGVASVSTSTIFSF